MSPKEMAEFLLNQAREKHRQADRDCAKLLAELPILARSVSDLQDIVDAFKVSA